MFSGTRRWLAATAVTTTAVALLAAACSSSKSTTTTAGSTGGHHRGRGHHRPGGLLDAPGRLHPDRGGLPEDAGRQGRALPAVLRRLGRPEPGGGRRPAGRLRRLLARARRDPPGQGRPGGLAPGTPTSTRASITDSVVVFVVRKGNPKHIQTWDDLTKPGVSVITPNPFSSGSARWNIMAAYGAQLKAGKTPAEAQQYLTDLFKNVVVQDSSARNAAADLHRRQGRRAARTTRTTPSSPSRTVRPSTT